MSESYENCPVKFSKIYRNFCENIESYITTYAINYDPETRMTTVDLIYNGRHFIGKSTIHPEDKEIVPNRWSIFGSNLARMRAKLKIFRYILATEINPVIKELEILRADIKKTNNSNSIKIIEREYERFTVYQTNVMYNVTTAKEEIEKYIKLKNKTLNLYRGQK